MIMTAELSTLAANWRAAARSSEQDPKLWEDALGPAIAGALSGANTRPGDVKALGVAGQLDGCIPVASDGSALGPALIWMDRRAVAETAEVDPDLVLERAGVVLDATHMAAKIRWLRRNGRGFSKVAG